MKPAVVCANCGAGAPARIKTVPSGKVWLCPRCHREVNRTLKHLERS